MDGATFDKTFDKRTPEQYVTIADLKKLLVADTKPTATKTAPVTTKKIV
jgi:hypothetical protein